MGDMMSDSDADHFSLRWNNFHDNLSTGFHDLLQGEDLVDVTLAANGEFVQAHKIVLSICSPYFKKLFKVNPCKHPIVILKDVHHKDLTAILQFMYRGEVNVRQEELSTFLKTAELLQIKGLTGNDSVSNPPPKRNEASHRKNLSLAEPPLLEEPRLPSHRKQMPVQEPSLEESRVHRKHAAGPEPPLEESRAHRKHLAMPESKLEEPRLPPQRKHVVEPLLDEPRLQKRVKLDSELELVTASPQHGEDGEGSSSVMDFLDVTEPKEEPPDYQSDPEQDLAESRSSRDDPLLQLLGAESSQSHPDSSPVPSMFGVIPGLHKDSGGSSFPGLSPLVIQDPGASDSAQGSFQFRVSQQGSPQLVYQGYPFVRERSFSHKIVWKCREYNKTGCRARCQTTGCQLKVMFPMHNHLARIKRAEKFTLLL